MSAAAFLRGAGNWTAYLNLGPPWLSAGWVMVATPVAIVAAAIAAAAGLAGLARRDMPEQRWLRLSVGLAALVALAGYPGPLGGPLHGLVRQPARRDAGPAPQRLQGRAGRSPSRSRSASRTRSCHAGQRAVPGLGRSRSVAGSIAAPRWSPLVLAGPGATRTCPARS